MKNLHLLVLSSVLAVAVSSCSRAPKSCFQVEVKGPDGKWSAASSGKVGDRFYFSTTCSKNAFGLGTQFDYGDGSTGTEQAHDYAKPGNYTVKCTVYSTDHGQKGDQSDVSTQSITVKDLQAEAR